MRYCSSFGDPISEDIKGLEINPRFGGGFPLGYSAGGTFPEWILNEYFQTLRLNFMRIGKIIC